MEHRVEEEARRMVEVFTKTKGKPFDPSLPITNSVCNMICTVAFGSQFSIEDKEFLELIEAIRISLEFGGSFFHGKEIDGVLDPSQTICYQDRKKMPFTHAVIHEILRTKYVLLFGIPRQCAKDVEMHGFLIPKGAFIAPDLRSVLFDPEHWETPHKFNPYHFLDQEGNFVTREAFLPFGAGARSCVGEQMARIELFIFLTSLLRAFTFHLPKGVKKLNQEPIVGLTMHPRSYKICAVPRFSAP
ncbi:hypothetical protein JD844_007990 [Phrynosoma platyrhinos]|uniref:Uncharacterized protein n=1 Tax=Phrynosoma platyrhinos TaxID=52577 RepID=A0ABQ7T4T0_PHRPL|nr:hypothetical protein JD844_007990 [Phrynosoma platyrhinos]